MTAAAGRHAAEPGLAAVHEVVLRLVRGGIGLSCACLAVPRPGRPAQEFIDVRSRFPAAEAFAAYRAWHAAHGIEVLPR